MLVILVGVISVGVIFYYFFVRPLNYWPSKGVKQGRPVWFFGDNWGPTLRLKNFLDLVQDMYNAVPGTRYSGVYLFMKPILLIKDPQLIKQITVKSFDHFVDHTKFVETDFEPLWTKNLLSLRGQEWRDMRPILSPTFTSSKMKSMFVLMSSCGQNFVKYFQSKNEKLIPVDLKDIFTRYCNDVIATTAFGVEVDSMNNPNNEFYRMGRKATNFTGFWKMMKQLLLMSSPKLCKRLGIRIFDKDFTEFFTGIIDETIRVREEKGIVRPDLINLLMEARKERHMKIEKAGLETGESNQILPSEITNIDITAQAMVFFFGGFEASSNLMSFMAYELAINPDIQQNLRYEINKTLEECNGNLTYDALLKMKYLDMAISETLRKWANNPSTDRECTKPFTIDPVDPGEVPVKLEKGDTIWIAIHPLHHDPKNFPDPERFDPGRFSEENIDKIKPYTYLPFGLGPRNCIGSRFALLECKTVFFYLLANFELVPTEKTTIPLRLNKKTLIAVPEGGFMVGLKRL